jgi:hypothetical protein
VDWFAHEPPHDTGDPSGLSNLGAFGEHGLMRIVAKWARQRLIIRVFSPDGRSRDRLVSQARFVLFTGQKHAPAVVNALNRGVHFALPCFA